ncbi:MAG: glutamate synthase subunit beta [Planctomycetia bacterium]|nr:glutamate synthase subunit beta [Planctomycetia bacterium]
MSSPKAFREIPRADHQYRSIGQRKHDFLEVEVPITREESRVQASRCLNCGIPFCHGVGCPLGNLIPDINRAVARGQWRRAWELLAQRSPFPEFTSRLCPALCEGSCTEGIDYHPVAVRQIERNVVDYAWENGLVSPCPPKERSGRRAAVIGSGPAGLAAAYQLNRHGDTVTVYEKNQEPGGLLRYGIPDFKLSKKIVSRRIQLLQDEGIQFVCATEIGSDAAAEYIARTNDRLVFATGTPIARDLDIEGRNLSGIYLALDFLTSQNRVVGHECKKCTISAQGLRVLVIGGGDTGSDCVGTAIRQGARAVEQIEIMPRPPIHRSESTPWPMWPWQLRTSSSHEEGCLRRWSLESLRFIGREGRVTGVEVVPVVWKYNDVGRPVSFERRGEGETIDCDLVLLALGFLKRTRQEQLSDFGVHEAENIAFVGDAAHGPSLVVRAIADGLQVGLSH